MPFQIHWQKNGTNNPLERIMREIRRRTWIVGAFPDGQSCPNLAAARLRYIAGSAWSAKRYMNIRPLYQMQFNNTEAVAGGPGYPLPTSIRSCLTTAVPGLPPSRHS